MEDNNYVLVSYNRGSWYYFRRKDNINRYEGSFWLSFLPDGSTVFTGDWETLVWKRKYNQAVRPHSAIDVFPRSNENDIGYWKSKLTAGRLFDDCEKRWAVLFDMIREGMDQIAQLEEVGTI